jgi:hypothetical protein
MMVSRTGFFSQAQSGEQLGQARSQCLLKRFILSDR